MAKRCMQLVDADRLCWAAGRNYRVTLQSLQPLCCSPKNDLIIGWALLEPDAAAPGATALGVAAGSRVEPTRVGPLDAAACPALAASAVESAVSEAAEAEALAAAAAAAAAAATVDPAAHLDVGRAGTYPSNTRKGKNGGNRLGRPEMPAQSSEANGPFGPACN